MAMTLKIKSKTRRLRKDEHEALLALLRREIQDEAGNLRPHPLRGALLAFQEAWAIDARIPR